MTCFIISQIEPRLPQFGFLRGLMLILLTPSLLLPRPRRKRYLRQGISVYPPNTYGSFLMTVIVWFFPSHLLWKVLAAQPWVEVCQHSAQLLSFPIAGERNCVTTVEIISKDERQKWNLLVSQTCTFAGDIVYPTIHVHETYWKTCRKCFRDNFPRRYVQATKGRPSSQLKRRTRGT